MYCRQPHGFDIICNSTITPMADIVRFGSLRIAVSLTILKCVHTFINNVSFPSPIDVGSHNS